MTEVEIGTPATMSIGSDRYAGTIIETFVSGGKTYVTMQEDSHKLISGSMMDGPPNSNTARTRTAGGRPSATRWTRTAGCQSTRTPRRAAGTSATATGCISVPGATIKTRAFDGGLGQINMDGPDRALVDIRPVHRDAPGRLYHREVPMRAVIKRGCNWQGAVVEPVLRSDGRYDVQVVSGCREVNMIMTEDQLLFDKEDSDEQA